MRRFLARLKEFESPTFRLGGGRSIQLSYRRIYVAIVPQKIKCVNGKNQFILRSDRHILSGVCLKGGVKNEQPD